MPNLMTGKSLLLVSLGSMIITALCSASSLPQDGSIAQPGTEAVGWKRFEVGEPAFFSVSFPRAPQSASRRISVRDGAGDVWLFFVANTTTIVSASYQVDDSGRTMSEHDKWAWFNNWAAGFVDSMVKNATLGASGPVSVVIERRVRSKSGVEGLERTVVVGECSVRLQSFFVGPRSLTLAAVWRTSSPKSEPAYFFDSLSLDMALGSAEVALISSPLAGWTRYELGEGSISAIFPKEPVEDREFARPRVQTEAAPVFFIAEKDDAVYGIGYLPDMPASAKSPSERAAVYASTWSMLEENLRRTIEPELAVSKVKPRADVKLIAGAARPIKLAGLSGEEKIFTIGTLEFRGQLALLGKRMFFVVVWATIETPLAAREAFLQSVRLKRIVTKP